MLNYSFEIGNYKESVYFPVKDFVLTFFNYQCMKGSCSSSDCTVASSERNYVLLLSLCII